MKNLDEFLSNVKIHIDHYGFDEVLDPIPYFKDLQIENWNDLVKKENGRLVNTTIYQSEKFRVTIIYWDVSQESSIHGHPERGGLIKVLSGQLVETRFDAFLHNEVDIFQYAKNSISYIHDMIALHQVKNPKRGPELIPYTCILSVLD